VEGTGVQGQNSRRHGMNETLGNKESSNDASSTTKRTGVGTVSSNLKEWIDTEVVM